MRIKVEEALRICEKYGVDEVSIVYMQNMLLRTSNNSLQLSPGMNFDPSHFDYFSSADIKEIEVVFNERLIAKLVTNFPGSYRQPIGRKNVIELDRIIDNLESSNAASKRKRGVISLTECYKKSVNGNFEPLIRYGEKLDVKHWNDVKVGLNRVSQIDYRFDEAGIIVFFLLNASDPAYAQKFMRFTELISLLVESKKTGHTISPDLNPEIDVFSVTEKSKLLETYLASKASLIIIGEDINEEYKTALAQLKAYDRFAKMMVIKNIDINQKVEIIGKIKTVYGQRLWES